jgi:PGF-CTERM protein
MTKRLTIALVAVALFVLMAVMPVSAGMFANGTIINQGATIFIGEEGLNVTHALNGAYFGASCGVNMPCDTWNSVPNLTTIGWWASAADIYNTAPSRTIDLKTRYMYMTVAPSEFVGYTGNWYLLGANGRAYSSNVSGCGCTAQGCIASLVFTVADPTLDIRIWDYTTNNDVTGKSVPQGEKLGFRIDTNMYAATDRLFRGNVIDGCPQPNSSWWANYSVNVSICEACGTFNTVYYYPFINGTDWIGWATWSTYAGQGCYSMIATRYYGWNVTYGWQLYNDTTYMYPAPTPDGLFVQNPACGSRDLDPKIDGFINLKIKDEANAQLNKLYNQSVINTAWVPGPFSVLKNFVNTQPWFWGSRSASVVTLNSDFQPTKGYYAWDTGALDSASQYAYPVGTYTISAESILNKMKDNYKQGGADYTGKTVSQAYTVTLVTDSVKIEANKDSIVRSKTFSVTVTGRPATNYYLWVKGTSAMLGGYDDQAPMIVENQEGVTMDPILGAYKIGVYQYENGGGFTIRDDVSIDPVYRGTREYASIKTSTSGTRTIEFTTTNWTKAQKYTIRVEQLFPIGATAQNGTFKNDEVDVKVEKGAVTIVAAGDQSYYLGEEIKFSGTNTETYKTYLFIVGPNLPDNGANIANVDPRHWPTKNQVPNTFKVVDVNGDNTWSWKWGTANYALDAGTYTIYAVSQPNDRAHLENAAYGTVSIIIKKPFVSATASQSTVAKGDRIYITGTAEGDPNSVMIWILGKNKYIKATETVNSDASFKYEVRQGVTKNLYSGQYFVVVQHPMQNSMFDVNTVGVYNIDDTTNDLWVYNLQLKDVVTGAYSKIFKLGGAGSLQGSDAAEALVQGINDANVDDTYTKLQFLVEEPVIRIDPIGDKHVGDKFTINAQTNLAVDDEVLVQVYSSSFKPTQKSQSGEFSGATGTVKVTKGDSGMNKISFDVDSSTFKPDEYIVTEEAVLQEATGTALFNVLETPVVTATPVVVVTTAAPTPVPTTIITTVPTPVPTTKSPGYGALIALIGLGAVAFIVVRRH